MRSVGSEQTRDAGDAKSAMCLAICVTIHTSNDEMSEGDCRVAAHALDLPSLLCCSPVSSSSAQSPTAFGPVPLCRLPSLSRCPVRSCVQPRCCCRESVRCGREGSMVGTVELPRMRRERRRTSDPPSSGSPAAVRFDCASCRRCVDEARVRDEAMRRAVEYARQVCGQRLCRLPEQQDGRDRRRPRQGRGEGEREGERRTKRQHSSTGDKQTAQPHDASTLDAAPAS